MFSKVGFIGTGNMGGALARAASKSGAASLFLLADKNRTAAEALCKEMQNAEVAETDRLAREADVIFLGVKPQMMENMLAEIAPVISSRQNKPLIITMAAGLTRTSILKMLGVDCPIIRIMPNTPAMVGCGMILYCCDGISDEVKENFLQLMSQAGRLDNLPEALIDAGSAVSGCGPAYAYLFIEALADGGVSCGLPRAKALQYAAAMVKGAAEMVLQTGKHPGELKDAVCSPGGTTIEGVRNLEKAGFRSAAIEAVVSAYEKTLALKK